MVQVQREVSVLMDAVSSVSSGITNAVKDVLGLTLIFHTI
jgi:hypothetical protein